MGLVESGEGEEGKEGEGIIKKEKRMKERRKCKRKGEGRKRVGKSEKEWEGRGGVENRRRE